MAAALSGEAVDTIEKRRGGGRQLSLFDGSQDDDDVPPSGHDERREDPGRPGGQGLLAQTPPQTDHEHQALRHRAEEIAAEMIWAARGETASDENEWDEAVLGPDPLRSTSGEETVAQMEMRLWLESLDETEAEQRAEQEAITEYRRRQTDKGQSPQEP